MAGKRNFYSNLKIVAIIHVVALLLMLCWGGMSSLLKEKEKVIIPVEFIVAVASSPHSAPDNHLQAALAPNSKPKLTPQPKPKPKTKPRNRIKVNNQRVRRNSQNVEPKNLLTKEEIERRLKMGATAGDRNTAIPDEDTRGFMLIRQMMYDLWQPPDKEVVGNKTAEVTLKLSLNGTLIYKQIVKRSGVAVMDTSVSAVLASAVRIAGLPRGFLQRHSNESITIIFKVD